MVLSTWLKTQDKNLDILQMKGAFNMKQKVFFIIVKVLSVAKSCLRPNFQLVVCNGCHDLLKMSMNLNDITILNIHSVRYCCIFNGINKSEAINLLQCLFKQKSGSL